MVHESHPSLDISRNDVARPRFVITLSLIQRTIISEVRRCGICKGGVTPISAQISDLKLLSCDHLKVSNAVEQTLRSTKSPSIPLYKGGGF
jgi:hypothetical protein